ncbi:MAG: glycoside hydrolase family 9 protein [Firmicutes bacterium]|nr:glycoside hydrolase family 9 protein [Bacillota bacterium]
MRTRTMRKRISIVFCLLLLTCVLLSNIRAAAFNYGEALQKTILFYEAQRSGSLSTSSIPTRLTWRGDSQLTDGQAEGLDLTGGWVDAGDNMKYVITMAEAVNMMAWGALEYGSAFTGSGQMKWLQNQLRWANDFFIKAHPSANVFYGQVGMTKSDHDLWIPIESTQYLTDRRAIRMDTSNPATDLVCSVAAAMAASSILFRSSDAAYANTLLTHAEQLYSFGENYRGTYYDAIKKTDPDTPYQSWSGYNDELCWGAAWLYKAEEAKAPSSGQAYLNKAVSYYSGLGLERDTVYHKYKWTHNYDDATFGCYVLMSQLVPGDAQYKADTERWLNWWTVGGTEHGADGTKVSYTPGGHARLDNWGSLRYAANTAFLAFVYSDKLSDATKKARYHDFAVNQINYILGQNPRNGSYIVGFGSNSPQHPHHRTAHGSWGRRQEYPAQHRHILYGALVGSPNTDDTYNDAINDYVANEVALDYNACLVGALARMYQEFGGTPLPDSSFPLADKPYTSKDEWPVFVKTYYQGTGGGQLSFRIENRSSWPARMSNKLKIRFFFTLDAGSISDVSVTLGTAPTGTTVSGPTLWDAANKVYYFTVDLSGVQIMPGYMWDYGGPEVTVTCSSASNTWNTANDWSFQNWDSTYMSNDWKYGPNIPVYEGTVKLNGNEPPVNGTPGATPTPTPTTRATATPTYTPSPTARIATPTPTRLVRVTPTRRMTPTPTRRVTPTPSLIVTPTPTARTATPTPGSRGSYLVNYVIQNDWGSGATINVNITNNTITAVNGWTLAFTFPGNQTITNLWNGTYTQSGASVSVKDAGFNANIPSGGGSVNFGFNLNYSGTNGKPAAFTLNGTPCGLL